MLKKGQIVKSVLTGAFYEVTSNRGDGWFGVRNIESGLFISITQNIVVLVGNNYKPKTNTPAR